MIAATREMGRDEPFMHRIECWLHTKAMAARHPPPPPSVKAAYDPGYAARHAAPNAAAEVALLDMDSIDCGLAAQAAGHDPVVLNLADDCFPGGCVDLGSGAQEESIFRRTNLCRTLEIEMYPLRDGEVVYSRDVSVFKAAEGDGWRSLSRSRSEEAYPRLAFVSGPGLKHPRTVADPESLEQLLSPDDVARLRAKAGAVLQAAHAHGHGCVVLGAMGCGAWKNPPRHVARVLRGVVDEHAGLFDAVFVAVKLGLDKSSFNFDAFAELFPVAEAVRARGGGGPAREEAAPRAADSDFFR
jgi:hypothetical protein